MQENPLPASSDSVSEEESGMRARRHASEPIENGR